jgi:hypothetical protein
MVLAGEWLHSHRLWYVCADRGLCTQTCSCTALAGRCSCRWVVCAASLECEQANTRHVRSRCCSMAVICVQSLPGLL